MVERDFYSFRYNFIPGTVDTTRPGSIQVNARPADSDYLSTVQMERSAASPNDPPYLFLGQENASKDWDCVLIYDEERGTFTLEKIDSMITFTYDKRTNTRPASLASTPRPTVVPPTNGKSSKKEEESLEAQLDRDLLEEDAEGEVDEETMPTPAPAPLPAPAPAPTKPLPRGKAGGKVKAPPSILMPPKKIPRPKKEEEDDSEGGKPLAHTHRPTTAANPVAPAPKAQAATVKAAPTKGTAAAKSKAAAAKPRPSLSQSAGQNANAASTKPVAGTKRGVDEEILEISRPSQAHRNKRQRSSSPSSKAKPEPVGLALPGSGSSGLALPGAPSTSNPLALPSLHPAPPADDSDNEEWDDVLQDSPPETAPPPPLTRDIFIEVIEPETTVTPRYTQPAPAEEDEGIELDLDDLEREMEAHFEEDDEEENFIDAALAQSPAAERKIMSLNQLAAANGAVDSMWGDEDYSSSSDDSEDDD